MRLKQIHYIGKLWKEIETKESEKHNMPISSWDFSKLASIVKQVYQPVVEEPENHQPVNDNHPVDINSAWWYWDFSGQWLSS